MKAAPVYVLAAALAAAPAALGADFDAVRGADGQGRTLAQATAGRPAVVLLTSPRVAKVAPQLRLLRFLAAELGEGVAVAAAVYGEAPATLEKMREGMPFPIIAAAGEAPPDLLGDEGRLPMTLLADDAGALLERLKDVPDPPAAAAVLGVKYDAGEKGPPPPGELLPELILATSAGGAVNLRAESLTKPRALTFVFDAEDERRTDYLAALQRLADDLGDELAVMPVMLGASSALAAKLAEAEYLDLPVLVGGELAARRLAGELALPELIMTEEGGFVLGAKAAADVPDRNELAAAEAGPAAEGEPVTLAVKRLARITEGLQGQLIPEAAFDATGRYIIYAGHYEPGDVDHLWEVTTAGKDRRQISYAPAPDAMPACAPDGVHIAFVSGRSGANEIWTCERVHGEFTQLTKSDGAFGSPRYSPDGDTLVCTRRTATADAENFDVWLLTPRGRRLRPLAETFYDEVEPCVNAEGDGVFFASDRHGSWDIFISDLRGGKRRRLTEAETEDRMPAASPDGKYVVYASREEGGPFKLWAMNVDGSSKTALTSGAGDDLYPRFARDGAALVFVSNRSGAFEVYKLDFELEPDYDLPRPPRPLAPGAGVS